MRSLAKRALLDSDCCICGLSNCTESTDHSYVPFKNLRSLIHSTKIPNPQIDQLKRKLQKFYAKLRIQLIDILQKDQSGIQQHLNQFYYAHLNPQKININELCQYANDKFINLPNKKAVKLINHLKEQQTPQTKKSSQSNFQQLSKQINTYISQFAKKKQLQQFKYRLPFSSTIQKVIPKLKLRRSQSQISNPQQMDEEDAKLYTWKNFTLRNKTKVLELSNKNITDNDLLRQMPVLSSFKNVKDFQIRHNRITSFSCKVIVSNMNHVKSIDIRGNPIGDEGVICLINGLPYLRSFMISQTNCTNVSAEAIVNGLKDLQKLWCENNTVDDQHAIKIGEMPKLKVLSFAGNNLTAETGEKLKKIFNSKGYVIV